MKKTVLVALVAVMVSTPCFAQEVEPEGIFSIEGTLWNKCGIDYSPGIPGGAGCIDWGFYQGKVYRCYDEWGSGYICDLQQEKYIDLLVGSLSYFVDYDDALNEFRIALKIMQPMGFGVYSTIALDMSQSLPKLSYWGWGIMFKVNDNWTPPSK